MLFYFKNSSKRIMISVSKIHISTFLRTHEIPFANEKTKEQLYLAAPQRKGLATIKWASIAK